MSTRTLSRRRSKDAGFTLIELLLASAAAAVILVAIYGVFTSALRMRDHATARIRESRLRLRAASILRRDLEGALVSGGTLANILEGDSNKQGSIGTGGTPGYLKMTTTTGKDTATDLYGDVQEVQYYIKPDTTAGIGTSARHGGTLVRTVTRELLASTTLAIPVEEQVLPGVESFRVAFYDGTTWQESWQANPDTGSDGLNADIQQQQTALQTKTLSGDTPAVTIAPALPEAVRIDIRQSAPSSKENVPPPLEILLPWTTQPFSAPTPTPTPIPGLG